jgi:CHAT domain-containing protein
MGKGFGKPQKGKKHCKAYLDFLNKVVQATADNKGDPQMVYPLLKANLNKLDDKFALLLREWEKAKLSAAPSELARDMAVFIVNISNLMKDFPLGNKALNLEMAITGYEIAATVLTHEVFPEEWAATQNNLGTAYLDRISGERAQNLDDAIAYFHNALQVRTYERFPEEWAATQINLGATYRERIHDDRSENLEQAIIACQKALQVLSSDTFPQYWALAHNNLGNAYCNRIHGDPSKNLELAIESYQCALQVFTFETWAEDWAMTQNNLGLAYNEWTGGNRAENIEQAIVTYQSALQVFIRNSFPQDWAMLHNNLGNAYCERIYGERSENIEQAIAAYQSALQVYTYEFFPEHWAQTQNNLGTAYSAKGQLDEAIECFRLALKIRTPTANPAECYESGRNFGNTAFIAGCFIANYWTEAIEGYTFAIEALETSRTWAKSESRRQEILAEAIGIYANMVQACINAGQLEKAIETVERSRSKRLVDLMASNDLYQGGEIPSEVKELLQQFDDLQERIDQERSQNNSDNNRELMGVGSRTSDRATFQAYNEAIAKLEAQKLQIWNDIRSKDPVLAGEIQVNAPDFAAMQKLIDQPTTAILSFYTTRNDIHIFILRQNQISLHTCPGQGIETLQGWISQNWLQPYAASCHPDIPKQERDQFRAEWISQISPFLTELAQRLQLTDLIAKHLDGIEELILVPHLLLHQIPFAALPILPSPLMGEGLGVREKYLGDKFLIRYTPSCQVLEFCQQRGEVEGNLAYGTVEDAEDNLPCASFEGEQIAQFYNIPNNRRLRGSTQATRDNYRQLAEQVQVIHSCHHAESCLDNPLNSQLKLGDGSITLGQLMTPGWRLPKLSDVFLSCCETGLGLPEITDDILTLSTGFLCAGARSVVSTLWSVDDLATTLFSIFYYQHRQQGKSRPEALRQAQIKLRSLKKEDLAELSRQVAAGRQQARTKRKQYQPNSAEYLECDREYRMYAGVTIQIDTAKKFPDECPFSHPCYWAAFTCQGLS